MSHRPRRFSSLSLSLSPLPSPSEYSSALVFSPLSAALSLSLDVLADVAVDGESRELATKTTQSTAPEIRFINETNNALGSPGKPKKTRFNSVHHPQRKPGKRRESQKRDVGKRRWRRRRRRRRLGRREKEKQVLGRSVGRRSPQPSDVFVGFPSPQPHAAAPVAASHRVSTYRVSRIGRKIKTTR